MGFPLTSPQPSSAYLWVCCHQKLCSCHRLFLHRAVAVLCQTSLDSAGPISMRHCIFRPHYGDKRVFGHRDGYLPLFFQCGNFSYYLCDLFTRHGAAYETGSSNFDYGRHGRRAVSVHSICCIHGARIPIRVLH